MKTIKFLLWTTNCALSSLFESPIFNSIFGMGIWLYLASFVITPAWLGTHRFAFMISVVAFSGITYLVQSLLLAEYEVETGLLHKNQMCDCKDEALAALGFK